MPEQRYEAGRQTIGALLSTTSPRIEVPEWQRSYSWSDPEIENFWQDLTAFDKLYPGENIQSEEYFLGSIVLVTGGPTNLLLDGQQRLATGTILLSALRDSRQVHKADAATRLQNKYILDFDDATNKTTPVLTLNVYDRDFFRAEIQDVPVSPPSRPTPTLRSHALVRKARAYFDTQITKQAAELGGGQAAFDWNLRVGRVLCDHMSVVAVSSTDEDNAASVFETLNDRGIGLSTPDLLRNLLLRQAKDESARERIVAAWQQVLAIHDEANVDEYLRHYWVSHRGDVKSRKLYREIKDTIAAEGIDSLTISLDLADTAPVYRDIARARSDNAQLERLLADIRALGAKVLYPAMLSGFAAVDGDSTREELQSLASALIALFVRYNVVGGRETTVLESKVYAVAADLRSSRDFDTAITTLASLAPSAKDFVAQFSRASVSRIATARYLLREIEHAKRVTQELAVEGTDRVHVEHIYPQTPLGEKWPNHAAVINRLGNLTLLSKRLNASIKNAEFAAKKEKAYATSDILMTKELMAFSNWDSAKIAERQKALSAYAFDIWRFPGEEPPGIEGESADDAADPGESEEVQAGATPDQLPEVPTG